MLCTLESALNSSLPEAKAQRSKKYLIPLLAIHSVMGALVFIRDDTYTDNVDGSCLQGDYSLTW